MSLKPKEKKLSGRQSVELNDTDGSNGTEIENTGHFLILLASCVP